MEPSLAYNKVTQTIRQVPENYLIAHWDENKTKWICDPDPAADIALATTVFHAFMGYPLKYNQNGDEVLSLINPT